MLNTTFAYTPEQQQKLADLRQLISGAPNLDIGSDDIFLSKFLSYKNWDIERAFGSIYAYYSFKAENPDWMLHHPVEYFREEFLDIGAKFLMSQPDKDGRPIVVFKMVDAFKKYPNYLKDLVEIDDLVYETVLLIPQAQANGVTFICDLSGFNRNFLPLMVPRFNRLINDKNKIMPFSKRTIHFIQSGVIKNTVASLLMPLLDKEFKENIVNHDIKKLDKLRDMIGYENLPAEYGGPEKNKLDVNILWNHAEKHSEYLLKLQSYKKLQS